MRAVRVLLVGLVLLVALAPFGTANAQVSLTPFTQLFNPVGVAIGLDGTVYASSDAVNTTTVTHFAADGSQLHQAVIGGIEVGNLGRIAIDATTGHPIYLASAGQIYLIDSATMEVIPLFDLTTLPVDTSAIFDITTGAINPDLTGIISPHVSSYGDISVGRKDAETLDFFVSGSTNGYPFIMRIRLFSDGSVAAKVLVSSIAPNVPEITNARGVAVNPTGTVLTTLPSYPNGEFLVSFYADFDEAGSGEPLIHASGLTSQGMDVDGAGNFYIATGLDDVPLCDLSGGAVIAISADISTYECTPPGLGLGQTRDLAVAPDGSGLYLTAASGTVWWYDWPE